MRKQLLYFLLSCVLAFAAQGADSKPEGPDKELLAADAPKYGLTVEQARKLFDGIEQSCFGEGVVWHTLKDLREEKADAIPFLLALLHRPELPVVGTPRRQNISQLTVVWWLVVSDDARALEPVLAIVQQHIKEPVDSARAYGEHYSWIHVLAEWKHDEVLDFLFKLQADGFLDGPDGPRIDIPPVPGGSLTSEELRKRTLNDLQCAALTVLSYSGSTRALKAFATGEGLNPRHKEEFPKCFRDAARVHVGIRDYPEFRGQALSEEREGALKAVYKEYSQNYIPVAVKDFGIVE